MRASQWLKGSVASEGIQTQIGLHEDVLNQLFVDRPVAAEAPRGSWPRGLGAARSGDGRRLNPPAASDECPRCPRPPAQRGARRRPTSRRRPGPARREDADIVSKPPMDCIRPFICERIRETPRERQGNSRLRRPPCRRSQEPIRPERDTNTSAVATVHIPHIAFILCFVRSIGPFARRPSNGLLTG
jgi:hypothetical protein